MILYHQLFLDIRKILNQYDPVGIIYGDINSDEYDIEVRAILELITDQETHESLAQKLQAGDVLRAPPAFFIDKPMQKLAEIQAP